MNKKVYKKKKINIFYMSIGFLVFTILLTGGLYFYNMSLINANSELDNSIKIKKDSIADLEKNPKIVASNLYNNNLSAIKKLEDQSNISTYITHLMKLSRKYNIDFKGFKYSSGKLSTQAIASSDGYGINYKKVVRFIEEYRQNKDLSSLFDLELVKNVTSKDSGTLNVFTINLSLKNNIANILKKAEAKKLEIKKQKELEAKKRNEEFKKRKEEFLKKAKESLKSSTGSISGSGVITQ